MPDHIHLLSDLHPSISLSDYIKGIKVSSSIWMKQSGLFTHFTGWAEGYAAFTYSLREKEMICNYIKKQQEHHATFSFRDELKRLLIEHGIAFDEQHL
jgi:REP element-mobilizing transposase RayT